jgi:hypothetical protein
LQVDHHLNTPVQLKNIAVPFAESALRKMGMYLSRSWTMDALLEPPLRDAVGLFLGHLRVLGVLIRAYFASLSFTNFDVLP